ncbi:TATA box-binding protein-associated factor RNA polymerase I subunit B [Procambarus clarkii]|uniref:TATA box-binding protein-associated factor RNA polymerase I subunit B n=1 Tax=Procambarus clarkii TaxID=6728 RepID=UPI001E6755E4|nr:uncharacterized protein LOC123762053 [Procambarus clarkii]XP_045604233.1 uncharacterized protein LOC123762053 [Procambarus clarkii]XP_045604235.1 uncharacterized protein LOC123762053 [Procambarus clarkii]XP_045604236.1 uncharacterized protein LOC123762053 [Procambarus clarkii]XP_045604237.1 uncharacterized protein LOC123762053 [Procambarus clarkii]XP_045604238.1 uncharacterized protein LOC123762053 [Procambarus clarkii]
MSKKCRQCGSTSFSIEAGLKICDQCGVEQKGYIELESQELISEVDRSRFASKRFDEDDEAEVAIQEDKELNNWTTYEAYNVVLYEWTQALCGLGASQHFKQVIYKLWVMYLHNLEIAFLKPASSNKRRSSGSNKDAQPKVSLIQSPRDVQLINFGKESVCSSSMSVFSDRRKKKKKKKEVSELDNLKKKTERQKYLKEFKSSKNSSMMSCSLSQELSKSLSEWESTSFISNSAAPSFNDEESVYSGNMDHPSDVSNAMSEDWQSFITGGGDTYNRHDFDYSQTDEDEPQESRVEVCRNKFVRNWILQRTRMYESENEGEEINGSIFEEAKQEVPFDCHSKKSSFNASSSQKSDLDSQVKKAQRIAQMKRARRKAQKITASQQRWFRTKQALHISFRKLLGLLYLAVLIAKEEILLLDIIRWCREGHIPYMSAQYLLKPDMKLFSRDLFMLRETQTLPTAEELQSIIGNLVLFLNIQSVPLPSVNDVIMRLVKILRLPESVGLLAQKVKGLEKTVYHNKQGFKFPAIESLAMASIIIVLKACYGVNDHTEVQLSRLAVKINEEIQPRAKIPPLFSWDEWERYMCKVVWFCNQIDPVSAENSQKFEELVTMDSSQFERFFWSEGIWRYPKTLREEKKIVPFVQKILEWQGDSLEKKFSQPTIFKPTHDPFLKIIEQFLAQHRADKHNIHNMVKVAEKLVETSFSHHTVDWTGKLGSLQESLKTCNSDIILMSEKDANQAKKKKLGSKQRENGRKTARGNTLVIPVPLEKVWRIKKFNKSNWKRIYDSCPSSFKWLVHLGSLVCETTDKHIFSGIIKLDRKRPTKGR